MSHHFRQPDASASPFEQIANTEHSWRHQASQDAYEGRGYHHTYHRHGEAYSKHLPEFGLKDHYRRHTEERDWQHHVRRHAGRIGRSPGGDENGAPEAPQSPFQSPFGDNSGFPGFGDQPQNAPPSYGRRRGGVEQPQASSQGWGQQWGQQSQGWDQQSQSWDQQSQDGDRHRARYDSIGRAGGLTPGQQAFASEFASQTGLDRNVVNRWLLNEESGRAARNREAHGNMNWLNIGYTDTAHRGTSNSFWYGDPVRAADVSAAWMKGEYSVPGFGRASHGIRSIGQIANASPHEQYAAIRHSGWASSGYRHIAGL